MSIDDPAGVQGGAATSGEIRLLIVDDSPEDRAILRRHLKRAHFAGTILEAETAGEAVGIVAGGGIDLVFLDHRLPDSTGVDTVGLLRNGRHPDRRPVVTILTGSGNEALAVEAMKAGASDYLVKGNITPSAIGKVLRSASRERAMERALSESERHFTSLADAAPVNIWMSDTEGRAHYLNRGLLEMLASTRDRLLGEGWLDRFHPDDLPGIRERMTEASRLQQEFTHEARLQQGSGYGYVLLMGRVRFGADGEVRGFTGSLIDISEKKAQQQALRTEEARYKAIFSSHFDAVISTDSSGRITGSNPKAKELFGYSEMELLGRNVWILFHTSVDFDDLQDRLVSVGDKGLYLPELRLARKNNTSFPAEAAVTSLRSESGTLGYLYTLRDITHHKESALKLAEVSRRLANSREDERRRLARELHDGPVQDLIALGYELAAGSKRLMPAEPELGETVAAWRQEATRIMKQLREVINDLRPAGLDELGLVPAMESFFIKIGRRYGLDIVFEHGLDRSLDDETNLILFRSAQEAITNTIKHAEAKRVRVTLEQTEQNVSLWIEDDGRGFRVPKDLHELSGSDHFGLLGLAERLQLARGNFTVRSAVGRGTEVFVSIPCQRDGDRSG